MMRVTTFYLNLAQWDIPGWTFRFMAIMKLETDKKFQIRQMNVKYTPVSVSN